MGTGEIYTIKLNVRRVSQCKALQPEFWLVYCVNWLCATAQNNRWNEDLNLTKHEMQWTIRWYVNELWRVRRDAAGQLSRGHTAYEIAMWDELARVSDITFSKVNSKHPGGWHLIV
jgi:hypothetical protein